MTDEKLFACEECGQVYYSFHPEKCINMVSQGLFGLFGGYEECGSNTFKEIREKDTIDIHDVPLYNILIPLFDKLFKK